jgi:hypothetical protein
MTIVFVLLIFLLALPPTAIVSFLILKKNWRPVRTLIVDVPYGALCGILLAWLMGIRGVELLVGGLVGGVLAFVAMRTRARDIEVLEGRGERADSKAHGR